MKVSEVPSKSRVHLFLKTLILFMAVTVTQQAYAEALVDRLEPRWGKMKLKVQNTSADLYRASYYCYKETTQGSGVADLNQKKLIDRDTFPRSKEKTRGTRITKARCSTGLWAVTWEIKIGSKWRSIEPGKGVCGTDNFACGAWVGLNGGDITFSKYQPNTWFKWENGTKSCVKIFNGAYIDIHIKQRHSVNFIDAAKYGIPNDKNGEISHLNCET